MRGLNIKNTVFIFATFCSLVITLKLFVEKSYTDSGGTDNRSSTRALPDFNKKTSQVFCEATTLGCFTGISNIEKAKLMLRHSRMNTSMCLKFCFDKKTKYALLLGGQTCICMELLPPLPKTAPLLQKGICDIPCPSAEENCGGNLSVRAFLLKGPCVQAPFGDQFVASRSLGCFRMAPRKHNFSGFQVESPNQCLLACEEKRQPLAIYQEHGDGECWCGHMDARFNLTHREASCTEGSYKVYRTTAEDDRCGNIGVLEPSADDGGYKRTLLLSFPGSGNTWTRYLLEKATGFYTGSVYRDASLYNSGYLGEFLPEDDVHTDLIKSHRKASLEIAHQAIFIVRNPFRALLAFSQPSHTGIATKTVLREKLQFIINRNFYKWKECVQMLVGQEKPFLVIYYEDLVKDPIGKVREMVQFASMANPKLMPRDLEQRLACLSQETTGLQKRNSTTKYNLKDLFETAAVRRISNDISEVRKLLKDAGVEKELPFFENDPL